MIYDEDLNSPHSIDLYFRLMMACSPLSSTNSSNYSAGSAYSITNNTNPLPIDTASDTNIQRVTVAACGNTLNIPCVSVTVCIPGTSTCQTIDNILLDTGSYGLRIFSSLLNNTMTLPAESIIGGKTVTECVSYLDGSSDWGPVVTADIKLNGEIAASAPMQLIDASFATVPAQCDTPDSDPTVVGFNGILGVGQLVRDCGTECATNDAGLRTPVYWECPSSGSGACTAGNVPTGNQVVNPTYLMTSNSDSTDDSQGIAMVLPGVPDAGATTAPGYIVFGIGSRPNNTEVSGQNTMKVYLADASSSILTSYDKYNNSANPYLSAFLDSGSNALFFPAPTLGTPAANLYDCSGDLTGFYCPSSEVSMTAAILDKTASVSSGSFTFGVLDAGVAFDNTNPNLVFDNLGGELSANDGFDWGLPFFLGKTIFVGLEGQTGTINGTN